MRHVDGLTLQVLIIFDSRLATDFRLRLGASFGKDLLSFDTIDLDRLLVVNFFLRSHVLVPLLEFLDFKRQLEALSLYLEIPALLNLLVEMSLLHRSVSI